MSDATEPANTRKTRRDIRFKVRVCPEEAVAIRKQALAVGMPVTTFMRSLALGYQPRAVVDHERITEMLRVNGDLGRLGGLLKLFLSDDEKLRRFDTAQVSKVILVALRNIDATQAEIRSVVKRALREDGRP